MEKTIKKSICHQFAQNVKVLTWLQKQKIQGTPIAVQRKTALENIYTQFRPVPINWKMINTIQFKLIPTEKSIQILVKLNQFWIVNTLWRLFLMEAFCKRNTPHLPTSKLFISFSNMQHVGWKNDPVIIHKFVWQS